MSQVLRQADDKYDRTNDQQVRQTIQRSLDDLGTTSQRKTTSRGGLSTYQGVITLANGANNNVSLDYATYIYITGPTGAFSISGFKNGEKGSFIILRNSTAQTMTITNEGGSSSANNRIKVPGNADLVVPAETNGQTVLLQYDTSIDRWVVLNGGQVFKDGALGTPTSGTLTNCTGLPVSTGISGLATGVATFLATPSSANLRGALTDESGTGAAYFQGGDLGTPSAGVLTNATGLPVAGIVSSTSTALGVGSLELGNASDTTLSRASGGQLAVEGNNVLTAGVTASITTISSGSLPAAATQTISSIPATYSYLVLQVTGWSQNTNTTSLRIRVGNGSADSTTANYIGISITTTTTSAIATADCAATSATQTIAQTGTATIVFHGYQAGPHHMFQSRVTTNTTQAIVNGCYIGSTSAIDTIEIGTNAAGNFDAGTYALYGIR